MLRAHPLICYLHRLQRLIGPDAAVTQKPVALYMRIGPDRLLDYRHLVSPANDTF